MRAGLLKTADRGSQEYGAEAKLNPHPQIPSNPLPVLTGAVEQA